MSPEIIERQLDVLYRRCRLLAEAAASGALPFSDCVDLAWDAAEQAGVVLNAGPDEVQQVLARAFMEAMMSHE